MKVLVIISLIVVRLHIISCESLSSDLETMAKEFKDVWDQYVKNISAKAADLPEAISSLKKADLAMKRCISAVEDTIKTAIERSYQGLK